MRLSAYDDTEEDFPAYDAGRCPRSHITSTQLRALVEDFEHEQQSPGKRAVVSLLTGLIWVALPTLIVLSFVQLLKGFA